jgi:hypothetical protein
MDKKSCVKKSFLLQAIVFIVLLMSGAGVRAE